MTRDVKDDAISSCRFSAECDFKMLFSVILSVTARKIRELSVSSSLLNVKVMCMLLNVYMIFSMFLAVLS
jgi:hypothetical protein